MKRMLISTAAIVVLFLAATLISNQPVRGNDNDQNGEDRESQSKIQIGFDIAPVPLNLQDKNRALVGLGSYPGRADQPRECFKALKAEYGGFKQGVKVPEIKV